MPIPEEFSAKRAKSKSDYANTSVPPPPSRQYREAIEAGALAHEDYQDWEAGEALEGDELHESSRTYRRPLPPSYPRGGDHSLGYRQPIMPKLSSPLEPAPPSRGRLRNTRKTAHHQTGAVSRAATALVRGVNQPLILPSPKHPLVYGVDRRDPFLHLLGIGGMVALLGGGFLTVNAFNGSLAGWIAAFSLTIIQVYCRRSAKAQGWTVLYATGFLFTALFSSYFNLIGLLSFHGYSFDFRPVAGVLWKSIEKIPQVVELYMLIIYFFAALVIDVMAEPLCMHWFEAVLPYGGAKGVRR